MESWGTPPGNSSYSSFFGARTESTKPTNKGAESKRGEPKQQVFDYFLVLDVEGKQEILELPVALLNAKTLEIEDRFHR